MTKPRKRTPVRKDPAVSWDWSRLLTISMLVVESAVWFFLALFVVVGGWRVLFGDDESREQMLDTLERLEKSWHVLAVMIAVPLFYRAIQALLQRVDRNWLPWGKKVEVGSESGKAEARHGEVKE